MTRESRHDRARRAEREIEALARLLDDRFELPGTGRRFGIDALIGLIPGFGDAASAGIGGYLVLRAVRIGVPGVVVARMVFNTLFDLVMGLIPLLGDLFDFAYKSNARNVALMREYINDPDAPTERHWMFLVGVVLVIVGVLALLVTLLARLVDAVLRELRGLGL